jgi:hypothetical protein
MPYWPRMAGRLTGHYRTRQPSFRQPVAAVGRRVATLRKDKDGLRHPLALYHTYYNFCLPHAS